MRIAITSQNFRTITGHAGKSRRFLILEADGQDEPQEVERLELPPEMSLHDYPGDDHPLFELGLDAIVTQSAGDRFIERMTRHGILVHATSATDPVAAAQALASGQVLPVGLPHAHDHTH